jgi:hypothetical protein
VHEPAPPGCVLAREPAGDAGRDRAVSRQLARGVRQPQQGREVDGHVDGHSPDGWGQVAAALEAGTPAEDDVEPARVHRAVVALARQAARLAVEGGPDRLDVLRWSGHDELRLRRTWRAPALHPAFLAGAPGPRLGERRLRSEGRLRRRVAGLAHGRPAGQRQDLLLHPRGSIVRDVADGVDEHARVPAGDLAVLEVLEGARKAGRQRPGRVEQRAGSLRGATRGCGDLCPGRRVVELVGGRRGPRHRDHSLCGHRVREALEPAACLQELHHRVRVESGRVDRGEQERER